MNITHSNVNFNGAFLINYANKPKSLKEEYDQKIRGKIVFEDFGGKDKVLYVLKDSKDFYTADFIKLNNLRFKYYPDMNTKLPFDPYQPNLVQEYIDENQPRVIRNKKELTEFIAENRTECRAIEDSHKGFPRKLAEKLIVNINGKPLKNSRGVTIVRNESGRGMMKISPWSENGICYVYVEPSNSYDEIKRYAVDRDCNVLDTYSSPEGIQQFYRNFENTIRAKDVQKV